MFIWDESWRKSEPKRSNIGTTQWNPREKRSWRNGKKGFQKLQKQASVENISAQPKNGTPCLRWRIARHKLCSGISTFTAQGKLNQYSICSRKNLESHRCDPFQYHVRNYQRQSWRSDWRNRYLKNTNQRFKIVNFRTDSKTKLRIFWIQMTFNSGIMWLVPTIQPASRREMNSREVNGSLGRPGLKQSEIEWPEQATLTLASNERNDQTTFTSTTEEKKSIVQWERFSSLNRIYNGICVSSIVKNKTGNNMKLPKQPPSSYYSNNSFPKRQNPSRLKKKIQKQQDSAVFTLNWQKRTYSGLYGKVNWTSMQSIQYCYVGNTTLSDWCCVTSTN